MKLTCPKCHSNLRIPAEKVPITGAWASCPKCQERFFIKPPAQQQQAAAGVIGPRHSEALKAPQTAAPPPAAGSLKRRDQESQRLLERMKRKRPELRTEQPEPIDFSALTVYPEFVSYPVARQVVTGILLATPLVVMAVIFYAGSNVKPQPLAPSTTLVKMQDKSNTELVKNDLRSLRKHMQRRQNVVRMRIDSSGPEARIFNYFMERMVPGVCEGEGISSLRIAADSSKGFSALGTCTSNSKELEMNVVWTMNTAKVSFTGYPAQGTEEIDLFPQPIRHTAYKEQRGSQAATH